MFAILHTSSVRRIGKAYMDASFLAAIEARSEDVLDRCTRCGGCFEVCPMTAPAGLTERDAVTVVTGVLDIIRGGTVSPDAQRWAQVCSGSGSCIPRCQYGVNPRFMLTLARLAIHRRASTEAQHSKGVTAFASMGRGVRVLPRIQLEPDVLTRLRTDKGAKPEVVFYT